MDIILSKKKPRYIVPVNPENPYRRFTDIRLRMQPSLALTKVIYEGISVTAILKKKNGSSSSYNVFDEFVKIPINGEIEIEEDLFVDSNDVIEVQFFAEKLTEETEITIISTTVNNFVSLNDPFKAFKKHIQERANVKILFSAPFGQGKTAFLNHFFNTESENYEVFKVFPVNYSISHNEDVFKYIKVEILLQLLGKNLEFDKNDFSYALTAAQFFLNDPVRTLSALVPLIPKVGKSITEVIEPMHKLAKEYFDYHKKATKSDKNEAEDFIKELYDKEGSIFEDNFYTQLIKQLLLQLKYNNKNKKENVLLIEDLDRMDPDHIFRVLNVFAAHFDGLDYQDGYSNKFGFDKIIIVGDYYNIKNIYEYRYGPKVSFAGYINKYYSKEPFHYNNRNAIKIVINGIRKNIKTSTAYIGLNLLNVLLNDLVAAEVITLRDLLKLLQFDALGIIKGETQKSNKPTKSVYSQFIYFNILFYLTKAIDIDSLILKLKECKTKIMEGESVHYDRCAVLGLPSLILDESVEDRNGDYRYKDLNLSFYITYKYDPVTQYEYYEVDRLKREFAGVSTDHYFKLSDFYDLLILNAEKYRDVDGFN